MDQEMSPHRVIGKENLLAYGLHGLAVGGLQTSEALTQCSN